MASYDEIDSFLRNFKSKKNLIADNFLFRLDRPSNAQTVADLDIAPNRVQEIIDQLIVEDYVQGPETDTLHHLSEWWVFGKTVKKREVYIKLSLGATDGPVLCISFHYPTRVPLVYPFKNQTKT